MIIFCACKNLLNNKKAEKNSKIIVLKGLEKLFVEEILLKVDLENKMVPQLWLL